MRCQKNRFSLDKGVHYLNNAYMAPLLKTSELASINALLRARNPNNIQTEDFFRDSEVIRLLYSKIIGAKAESICIHPSTSYSFRTVLMHINPKLNGHALIIEDAFPSGYYALERWCAENNSPLHIIRRPSADVSSIAEAWNDRIINAINDLTTIIILPNVHWMSGLVFDLEAIAYKCKQVGAKIIVDGTQSVGMLPINSMQLGLDALISAGYKWLLGPYSITLAYIKKDYHNGQPLEDAWMSRINGQDFQHLTDYTSELTHGASRFDMGERSNFITMPILKEGLTKMDSWGADAIQAYCKSLSGECKERLKTITGIEIMPGTSHHLFSIRLKYEAHMGALKSIFKKNRISVSQRGNNLRISVHVYNTQSDMDALVQSISTLNT